MGFAADGNSREPEPIRRLVEIDERRDIRIGPAFGARALAARNTATYCENGDKDVRREALAYRYFDYGGTPAQPHHETLQHAFALDGNQGRCRAKGHAHLKTRQLAALVLLLFRDYIHAVARRPAEPPFIFAYHPDRRGSAGGVAVGVARLRAQDHFARYTGRHLAREQALSVRRATALRLELARLAHGVVGIEAAD